MLRSFLGRKWVLASLAIGTVLAFSATVVPALGGPSLKQLVKKEVARQLKGKTGPQGPPGTPGANGSTSPSAASFVSSSPAPIAIATGDTEVLSTDITLANDSLLEANSMLVISSDGGALICFIKVDGTNISTRSSDSFPAGATSRTVPVAGAANLAAGLHTVTTGCQRSGGTGTAYEHGNLNVIAVG